VRKHSSATSRRGWVIDPRQVDNWLDLAHEKLEAEDVAGVTRLCQRILRYAPGNAPQRADALHYLALAYMLQNRFDAAYDALETAVAIVDDEADLWYNHGIAARFTSRQARALFDLERALALETDEQRRANIDREVKVSRQMAEHDRVLRGPDFTLDQLLDQEERYQQAVKLLAQRDWPRAEQAFRDVIARGDCLPQPWGNVGMCLIMQRRFDEAEAAYRRALELDPKYLHAKNNLAALPEIRRTGVLPEPIITSPFDDLPLKKLVHL